jgi:hypothetical protein
VTEGVVGVLLGDQRSDERQREGEGDAEGMHGRAGKITENARGRSFDTTRTVRARVVQARAAGRVS